jgi:hypothetical protein
MLSSSVLALFSLGTLSPCPAQTITSPSEEYFFFSPQLISSLKAHYTQEELVDVEKDLKVVRDVCFDQPQTQGDRPFLIATAGGPGSRKSTILERFIEKHPEYAKGIYLDPDQRALRFMVHTYYKRSLNALATASNNDYSVVRKLSYEKWRDASNYITLTLMEEALRSRQSIVYGTTATGEHVEAFFKKLRSRGYDITLLLCSCNDETRAEAVSYRNSVQKFYQCTPEDAVSKGKNFPVRMPVFFAQANTLYLFWSDSIHQSERLAAILRNGNMEIVDAQALDLFISKYNADRETLSKEGKVLPSWNDLTAIYTHSANK